MAARDDNLRAADPVLHRNDVGAQPVPDVVIFDDHPFPLRHDRFELAEIEDHIGTVETPHGAADDLARAILELLVNHFLLDLADALHHRLLRGLGRDAPEVFRRHFDFHFTADGGVRIDPACLGYGDLVGRIRDLVDDE